MRKIAIFGLLLLLVAGCAGKNENKEAVYKNADFGFSVAYPSVYRAKELKWIKEATGVELSQDKATITVQAMAAGTMNANMPFGQYVREAAIDEGQNFTRLVSIESFSSDYDIKGYRTYWEVVQHEESDTGESDITSTAGPIYYFAPRLKQTLGDQPVKTIMISGYQAPEKDITAVAASFRYLNSYKALFRKGHHGKVYFVKQGKPFRIELAANPTTGYNWYIAEMDENFFQVRSSGYDPRPTELVGSGGTSYWNIVPLKDGVSTIKLLYYRVWEGKEKAVDTFTLRVISL